MIGCSTRYQFCLNKYQVSGESNAVSDLHEYFFTKMCQIKNISKSSDFLYNKKTIMDVRCHLSIIFEQKIVMPVLFVLQALGVVTRNTCIHHLKYCPYFLPLASSSEERL